MQNLTEEKEPIRHPAPAERGEEESSPEIVEILTEGQECPFCHFAKVKREGGEIICPVCGYGRRTCT
jgi:uncharacterized Zn finger protein (UPF0148 family)